MSIPANKIEIKRLLGVARRELADAAVAGLSADGSFEHGYAAALTLATTVVRAHGERIHGPDHHRLTFVRLAEVAGGRWADVADYLQHCRRRRNSSVYDVAGSVSAKEAAELLSQAKRLLADIVAWLRTEHPELAGG